MYRELIADNNLTVMATQARYLMAYEFAGTTWERIGFWDKTKQLGRESVSHCPSPYSALIGASDRRASDPCL